MKRLIQFCLLALALISVLIIWRWKVHSERISTMQPTILATTAFPFDVPSSEPFTPSITPYEAGPIPFPSPQETPKVETIYTVLAGDTLWDIAMQFGLTIDAIIRANPNLNAAGLIFPGDQLLIEVELASGQMSFDRRIFASVDKAGREQAAVQRHPAGE